MAIDTPHTTIANDPVWRTLRWVVWGGAALLLLAPLIAMRFTREVDWSPLDFLVMGVLLALVGGAYELAVRVARSHVYVIAFGVAVGTAFLTVWANLAVGIVGEPAEPINRIYFGVVAVAVLGATLARLRPAGMARAMLAAALAQAVGSIVGLVADGTTVFVLTAVFAVLWLVSAALFRRAAGPPETNGAPR
jgi:MFS family permease